MPSRLLVVMLAIGLFSSSNRSPLRAAEGKVSGPDRQLYEQHVSFFGDLAPPLVIPWAQLSIGFGLALGLCLLAALWPAYSTGRTEPLKLLQEGRAAM